ncbi:hypothetical protein E4099_27325 [Streptomyces palmae]|uniref:Putative Flp pilus-assembly TadG-like N-terminal domain-containing protein n=2 Tax=Streptomyces palmae TaxID=1701085 RepID=A0A4Z0GB98_9ACTN|nr:pilus assembly protein TadG-related protein [Streptomyces palmae]TGA92661.1 hypothetical protein E4099_27325 [Streptomyces palmae]
MTARRSGDAGQAFPLYVTAVAGMLFLALAYYAVGRAGATRNAGQTAADAAALAAAQNYRDQLRLALLDTITSGGDWAELLSGRGLGPGDACADADRFAARNDADLTGPGCVPGYLPTSFSVTVRTRSAVGSSVIPGTERRHARARATAVLRPRCAYQAPPPPSADPTPTAPGHGPKDKGRAPDPPRGKPPLELDCEGGTLTIDPRHPDLFPEARDLFSVRLAE